MEGDTGSLDYGPYPDRISEAIWGFPKLRWCLQGPDEKDDSILASLSGSPHLRETAIFGTIPHIPCYVL